MNDLNRVILTGTIAVDALERSRMICGRGFLMLPSSLKAG